MTKPSLVFPVDEDEADLLHRVLCSTPHIYYATDGATYALSTPDAEAVRSLRYLVSIKTPALVLTEEQVSLLRAAVARVTPDVDRHDESDWYYASRLAPLDGQLKALLSRLDQEGSEKRAIYIKRAHH